MLTTLRNTASSRNTGTYEVKPSIKKNPSLNFTSVLIKESSSFRGFDCLGQWLCFLILLGSVVFEVLFCVCCASCCVWLTGAISPDAAI